jgi:hypothetical protein
MPTVTNRNFFSPIQAEFTVRKLPNVNFFCQRVNIPGLSGRSVNQPTPFSNIRLSGDHLDYHELEVTFKIDENLTNYLEVSEWIIRNNYPNDYEQYRRHKSNMVWDQEKVTSDGSVIFLNSKSIPKLECVVQNLFPVALSDIVVDTTLQDVDYLTATVRFAYTTYSISVLS